MLAFALRSVLLLTLLGWSATTARAVTVLLPLPLSADDRTEAREATVLPMTTETQDESDAAEAASADSATSAVGEADDAGQAEVPAGDADKTVEEAADEAASISDAAKNSEAADTDNAASDVAADDADTDDAASDGAAESAGAAPAAPRVARLVSAERDRQLRRNLPRVDDPQIQALLDDPRLILYTEREMPRAYQAWDLGLDGVHLASYNISANGSEPHGNGNIEFPWGTPAGTHRAQHVRSLRFLWLPTDDEGRTLPVVWYRKRLAGDRSPGYAWSFPKGAVLGEVLMIHAPDGYAYTFEMRLRIRELNDWAVDVFRPFPTALDLAERIKELRPEWAAESDLVALIEHLEGDVALPRRMLASHHPAEQVFRSTMGVDELPPIEDEGLVADLLTRTTFTSALGQMWRDGDRGTWTAAPTTRARFHVVPANYDAGFIEVDRHSCMRCHETVNQDVDRFQPARDWYGRIRGSDGIFSFHPFEPSSISGNGYSRPAAIRKSLIEGGLVARYQRDKHPADIYQQVPHLTE